MVMAKGSVTLSSLVGVSRWAMKKALLFTLLAGLFAAIAFGSARAGMPPPAAVCWSYVAALCGATCPVCVPPYCGHSSYYGYCVCITEPNGCSTIGGCSCQGGCHCVKVKASADVLSAKSTEHPWLRSQTFAQDMATYSPALNKVLTSIQAKVSEHKITSNGCMGKLGGGIETEDGGFIVYEMVRDDQHWELKVTQFDKAAADAFRERVKSGKTDIDPRKEYFAHPDARLVIEGANWTIYQGEQVRSGTITEK
jgi:hypothetical protein